MATRVAWSSFAALAAAAVLGCGRSAKAGEASRTVRSWEATVRLLRQAEGGGAVPARFARQVREAAVRGVSQAEATLQSPRQQAP